MELRLQSHPHAYHRARAAGFTLIELMVALVVLAIVLTLGIPSFRSTIERSRADTAVQRFEDALQFARLEALNKNAPVSLLPADSAAGWIAGVAVQRGVSDTLSNAVLVSDAIPPGVEVAVESAGDDVTRVTFGGLGALQSPAAMTSITLTTEGVTRSLNISPSGRLVRAEGL